MLPGRGRRAARTWPLSQICGPGHHSPRPWTRASPAGSAGGWPGTAGWSITYYNCGYTASQPQQPLAGGQPHLGLVLLLRGRQEAGRQQGVVLAVVLRGCQQGQRVVVRRRPGQRYIRYFYGYNNISGSPRSPALLLGAGEPVSVGLGGLVVGLPRVRVHPSVGWRASGHLGSYHRRRHRALLILGLISENLHTSGGFSSNCSQSQLS